MNTYKVITRCKDRTTKTVYVLAWSHSEAQQYAELHIKQAFVRITTVRVK